jgi:hypothetical protein
LKKPKISLHVISLFKKPEMLALMESVLPVTASAKLKANH